MSESLILYRVENAQVVVYDAVEKGLGWGGRTTRILATPRTPGPSVEVTRRRAVADSTHTNPYDGGFCIDREAAVIQAKGWARRRLSDAIAEVEAAEAEVAALEGLQP